MKKLKKIILLIFISILIAILYSHNERIKSRNEARISERKDEIIQVQIIDKYNNMDIIHENYRDENYEVVDMIIDGNYYHNVGIRTKGSAIYVYLKYHDSDRHSYKVKLDYVNKEQQYKRYD